MTYHCLLFTLIFIFSLSTGLPLRPCSCRSRTIKPKLVVSDTRMAAITENCLLLTVTIFFVVVGAESAHGLVLLDNESLMVGLVVEVLATMSSLSLMAALVGMTGQSQHSCCSCLAVALEHR
ncbi:hypothetical protein ACFX2I_040533 [Malus domestica]